jgi:Tol biopolymer transport system component
VARPWIALLVATALAAAGLLAPSPSGAGFPGRNGRIVFVSLPGRSGGTVSRVPDLWSMSATGRAVRRLTSTPRAAESAPAVSPDGRRVAYVRMQLRPRRYALVVADLPGASGGRFLRSGRRPIDAPAWTPDGRRLAFSEGQDLLIHALRPAAGEPRTRVLVAHRTTDNDPLFSLLHPSFAADGTLAFGASSSGDTGDFNGIWLAATDGTQVRLLVRSGTPAAWPEWSPDGRRLAYTDERSRLCLIDHDGSGKRCFPRKARQTNTGVDPAWSPDGRRIVVQRSYLPQPYQELALVDPRTGRAHRLTNNFVDDISPSWGVRPR